MKRQAAQGLRRVLRNRLFIRNPKLARFRVNASTKNRGAGAVFRNIPSAILSLDELTRRKSFKDLCMPSRGSRVGHRADRLRQIDDARRHGQSLQ